ncbi:MAG: phage Gp37/Gp68 family protein [Devosia sp.]
MADATKIEWCDSTFNPWVGCTKIAPACDHCYAESWAKRSGMVKWGNEPRRRTSEALWRNPVKWQGEAAAFFTQHGRRRRVFCASLADVFDNQVPPMWRHALWELIRGTPDLDWLLLTKRPMNIAEMKPAFWDEVKGHVWLGTTVEDQEHADRNIPHLLQHDSAVRFISAEPLLGPINLGAFGLAVHHHPDNVVGSPALSAVVRATRRHLANGLTLDWVIAGGESGPQARPSHFDWFDSLRKQCLAAGVPFLFKQWGEWAPGGAPIGDPRWMRLEDPGTGRSCGLYRHGKAIAGRRLDGALHDGFPEVAPP